MKESTKPEYYKIKIRNSNNESILCDVFDISHAMNLSLEQFMTLKYFRVKGDILKQINDTEKAIECLKRHLSRLQGLEELKRTKIG